VQGEVEAALATILRTRVELTVAGRTDAGVHAVGQVAHADVPAEQVTELAGSLLRRLAGVLPPDVRVRSATPAPEGFDARFAALSRRYVYRVSDRPWGVEPLRRRDTLAWPRPLDEAAMEEAAWGLLGEHDFAAYCRRREGATTVRVLQRLEWHRDPGDRLLRATAVADAFCHSMVRSLVGALLTVGEGRRDVDWPARVLAAGVRDPSVSVAPAHGLTLVEVLYPPDDQLAERVAITRRRREPATG